MIDPTSINLVLYHAHCSDGMGAAYAAWKLLGNKAEYIACNHGGVAPDVTGKNVAVVDFSFKNKVTKELIEKANSFIVIDHHKSAMVELHDISSCIFDMSKSGAVMSWEFFHPGKEIPKFLQYIQDRDLWKWEMPYSKEFSAAFDMVPFEFSEYEEFEADSVVDDAIKRGSFILAYSKTVINKICNKAMRKVIKTDEHLYDVLVVNSTHWQSEIGNALAKDCDIALIWFYDHNIERYMFSVRSFHEHIDVLTLTSFFGGGGHKKAAGFSLPRSKHPDTIFELDVDEEDSSEEELFGAD